MRPIILFILTFCIMSCSNTSQGKKDSIPVFPIEHASFIMKLNGKTIYVDPVGGASKYKDYPVPDFVLITHGHPDHLSPETLKSLVSSSTPIITTKAVKKVLPKALKAQTQVMNNGDKKKLMGIAIRAIPAYNLRPEAQKFHPKGRDNGYVLSFEGKRIYISGDTEDIPAMQNLKDIDVAFICMNLPYTMTVDQAVKAVTTFRPKIVYPYHYRNKNGYSDVRRFKREVEHEDPDIHVKLLNWYPDRK